MIKKKMIKKNIDKKEKDTRNENIWRKYIRNEKMNKTDEKEKDNE